MNLPHKAPIRFAQETLEKNEDEAKVKLTFPFVPSFAMMIEGAAQSGGAFNLGNEKIGFVISLKNVELIKQALCVDMIAFLKIQSQVENFIDLYFEIKDKRKTEVFAKGNLILKIEE